MPQTIAISLRGFIMIGIKGLLNAGGWLEVFGMNVSERQNELDGERRERQPTSELQFASDPDHPVSL
jgi:hypothetical protein